MSLLIAALSPFAIHFTGTAASPFLQLKRPNMPHPTPTNVKLQVIRTWRNTYLTGSPEQIARLLALAIIAARANVGLLHTPTKVDQRELNELRTLLETALREEPKS